MNAFTQNIINAIKERTGATVALYTRDSGEVAMFINDYHVAMFPTEKLAHRVVYAFYVIAKHTQSNKSSIVTSGT